MIRLALILLMATEFQFADWIEKDISKYSGEYIYFEFNGSEVVLTERITVTVQGESLRFAVESNAKSVSFSTQPLNKNSFRLRLSGKTQSAKFMRKLPPPNAKGKVEDGIRIGKKFFSKVGELP
jgi:hypothetical protein